MSAAFGADGWDDLRFETVDPAALFSTANYAFIFLEGSDNGADELEAFLDFGTNRAALQSYVAAGGRALLNAAPNEGNGMTFAFGVTLQLQAANTVEAASGASGNPMFAETGVTTFSGSSFSHATVTGSFTSLLQRLGVPSNVVLAERSEGAGLLLFGGMTTANFHSPQPAATNLRVNILRYAAGLL